MYNSERRSCWQGARNRLSWFKGAVMLSLLVRHDIKLDVQDDPVTYQKYQSLCCISFFDIHFVNVVRCVVNWHGCCCVWISASAYFVAVCGEKYNGIRRWQPVKNNQQTLAVTAVYCFSCNGWESSSWRILWCLNDVRVIPLWCQYDLEQVSCSWLEVVL